MKKFQLRLILISGLSILILTQSLLAFEVRFGMESRVDLGATGDAPNQEEVPIPALPATFKFTPDLQFLISDVHALILSWDISFLSSPALRFDDKDLRQRLITDDRFATRTLKNTFELKYLAQPSSIMWASGSFNYAYQSDTGFFDYSFNNSFFKEHIYTFRAAYGIHSPVEDSLQNADTYEYTNLSGKIGISIDSHNFLSNETALSEASDLNDINDIDDIDDVIEASDIFNTIPANTLNYRTTEFFLQGAFRQSWYSIETKYAYKVNTFPTALFIPDNPSSITDFDTDRGRLTENTFSFHGQIGGVKRNKRGDDELRTLSDSLESSSKIIFPAHFWLEAAFTYMFTGQNALANQAKIAYDAPRVLHANQPANSATLIDLDNLSFAFPLIVYDQSLNNRQTHYINLTPRLNFHPRRNLVFAYSLSLTDFVETDEQASIGTYRLAFTFVNRLYNRSIAPYLAYSTASADTPIAENTFFLMGLEFKYHF